MGYTRVCTMCRPGIGRTQALANGYKHAMEYLVMERAHQDIGSEDRWKQLVNDRNMQSKG